MTATSPSKPALTGFLRDLFDEYDVDKNGFLEAEEFRRLCQKIGLNDAAAAESFKRLDVDKDKKITFEEFAKGFKQYEKMSSSNKGVKPSATLGTKDPHNGVASEPLKRPTLLSPTSSSPSTLKGSANRLSPNSSSPTSLATRGRKSASPIGMLATSPNEYETSRQSPTSTLPASNWNSSSSVGSGFFAGTEGSGSELGSFDRQPQGSSSTTNYSYGVQHNNPGATSHPQYPNYYQQTTVTNQASHLDDTMIVYSSDPIDSNNHYGSGSTSQFGSLTNGSTKSLGQLRSMQDLMECVQKLQTENQLLAQSLIKDRKERDEYISQLGEEFDMQVKHVKELYNKRTHEEVESERKKYREMIQAELDKLQNHYQTFDKMNKLIKTRSSTNEKGGEYNSRAKVEDTLEENKKLEKSLLDTKSEVAVIREEMDRLKRQYEDKLRNAYARNNETRSECDDIKQQLTLMQNSNKKLQDASDAITSYITETVDPMIKSGEDGLSIAGNSLNSMENVSRRGSILSDYWHDDLNSPAAKLQTKNQHSSHKNDERSQQFQATTFENLDKLSSLQKKIPASPGLNEQNIELQKPPKQANSLQAKKTLHKTESNASVSSLKNLGRQIIAQLSRNESQAEFLNDAKDDIKTGTEVNDNKENASTKTETLVQPVEADPVIESCDGEVSARFSIILVGDSFVGKSSFAARFMGGEFVQGLISNCSIDFKTKNFKIDGVCYGIDLWDTAGQERFRSITASYFRKADGIILMYDVTEKRSYLNVRNWMSTISDAASENVAVLLVGNKIDLRTPSNKSKCVPTEEGLRLAKEYDILFLETSVKTGANLTSSIGRLIRLIANKKLPVEDDADTIKLNDKSRNFACMPKNC